MFAIGDVVYGSPGRFGGFNFGASNIRRFPVSSRVNVNTRPLQGRTVDAGYVLNSFQNCSLYVPLSNLRIAIP